MDETSQRLSTIGGHLTKALSSSDSQSDFSTALEGLCALEDTKSHKTIATGYFIDLLCYFLFSANSTPSRRLAGIITARLCHKSADVARLFSKIVQKDQRYNLVYGLGNLILEEGVREDLRLISGLIIRSCVYHGADHRIFWPTHEVHAPFPIDDGQRWVTSFYHFVHAADGLQIEAVSEVEEITLNFTQTGVATAALLGIQERRITERTHTPRRFSTTEALDVSVEPSSAGQPSATMPGSASKLAKMRNQRQSRRKSKKALASGSTSILVPESAPTKQEDNHLLRSNQEADVDDGSIILESKLFSQNPPPKNKTQKGRKSLGQNPIPCSKDNASHLASMDSYNIPKDRDDDLEHDAVAESPRNHGRQKKEPHRKRKKPNQPTKNSKMPTTYVSDESGHASEEETVEDSNDEDYHDKPIRGEHSHGHVGRRSKRLAAARPGRSSEPIEEPSEENPKHTVESAKGTLGPIDTHQVESIRTQEEPHTRSPASGTGIWGTKSLLDVRQNQSSSPKDRPFDRSSIETQQNSHEKAREKLDVESQRNETCEEFEVAVTVMAGDERIEDLETRPTDRTIPGTQSDPFMENLKQAKGSESMQKELIAAGHDLGHEHLLLASAPFASSTTAYIDFANFGHTSAQGPPIEQDAIPTNASPANNQEEGSITETYQSNDPQSEALKQANPGNASQLDPSMRPISKTKTAVSGSGQPDPSRSIFARKQPVFDQNTQPDLDNNSFAKKVLQDVGVSSNEREIEKAPYNDNTVGEETPLNESLHRNPTIINFTKTGPLNQGKTPSSINKLLKDHEKRLPSTATNLTTPSSIKSHLSKKEMPAMRTPLATYGSRSSKSSRDHVPFEELIQGTDATHQHRQKTNDKASHPRADPVVETAVEKTPGQKTDSESDGKDIVEDDYITISSSESGPSTPRGTASSPGNAFENPLFHANVGLSTPSKNATASRLVYEGPHSPLAIGPSTPRNTRTTPRQVHHDPGFPAGAPEEATIVHSGPTPSTTNQERSPEKPLQEGFKPLEKRRSLSPAAHNVIHAGLLGDTGPSPASNSGPTPGYGHQNPPSPAGAASMHPDSAPLAINYSEKTPEKPRLETLEPKKKRSLEPSVHYFDHDGLHAEPLEKPDVYQSPRKRTRTANPFLSSHKSSTTRPQNFMKAAASASPVKVPHRVPPLQRHPARQISEAGSPERRDARQPELFTDNDNLQAGTDDSLVFTRARTASSPNYSHGVMSSNRKKVPDPPFASSKAITSHAPKHMLEQSKLLNTPARPEADPFSSPRTSKSESAFMAMMREKTEALRAGPVKPQLELKTPGLKALINPRPDDDPDRTLVAEPNFPDDIFEMSDASTLDEDEAEEEEEEEEEDIEPREKTRHASEMEWEASLKPHQQNLSFILSRISERLVRHLIDSETAIEDVVAAFEHDGTELIEKMEQAHKEEFELERGAVKRARSELKSVLERVDGKVREEKKRFETRRNHSSSQEAGELREQIGALEGVLMDLSG